MECGFNLFVLVDHLIGIIIEVDPNMGSCQKENWCKSCFNEMGYIISLWYIESTGSLSYSCLFPPLLWDQPLHVPHSVSVDFDIVGAGGIDEIVNAPTSIDLPWDELIISSHYNSHRRTITIRPVHPPTTRVVRQYRLPRSYIAIQIDVLMPVFCLFNLSNFWHFT